MSVITLIMMKVDEQTLKEHAYVLTFKTTKKQNEDDAKDSTTG